MQRKADTETEDAPSGIPAPAAASLEGPAQDAAPDHDAAPVHDAAPTEAVAGPSGEGRRRQPQVGFGYHVLFFN